MNDTRIFRFHDGTADVYVDPSEVDYHLSKIGETEDVVAIDQWLDLPRGDDGNILAGQVQERQYALFLEACHRLDPYIRKAFGLKPFDRSTGEGMTHNEVINIYTEFMEWRSGLKKNIGSPPTGSTPTASTSDSSPAASRPRRPMASI